MTRQLCAARGEDGGTQSAFFPVKQGFVGMHG